jgi:WD40 repeat protein
LAANTDGAIRVWALTNYAELRCLRSFDEDLTAFAMLPDGHTLVTGGSGGSVRLWDTAAKVRPVAYTNWDVALDFRSLAAADAPTFSRETLGSAARRFGFAFTPDSRNLITTDTNGALALWDARSVRLAERLPALGSNHWGLALSPDGRWLAAGSTSGKLTIWEWPSLRAVTNFAVNAEWFGLLRFSRSGNFLFSTAMDNNWVGSMRIWRAGGWQEVTPTNLCSPSIWSVDLSPDERTLAAGCGDGTLRLFRFPSGEQRVAFTNHQRQVNAVLFTPDGRTLISTSLDGSARFWDVAAGRELANPLRSHVGSICAAALTPDGRRLVTGGERPRDAVKLWDLVARRELLSLPGEGEFFAQLVFSPDGSMLAAVSLSGTANLWRAPSWEEIAAAEKRQAIPQPEASASAP